MATVIPLTNTRRQAHYWRRLQYIGPTQPARCECGADQRYWTLRRNGDTPAIMGHDGYIVAKYRCQCGRPIIIVRELQRVRR